MRATRFRRVDRDYRYNLTTIHAHGQTVNVVLERSGKRWCVKVLEWQTCEWCGSEKAARQMIEDLKAGAFALV